jgi:hypothetical protein
MDNGSAQVKCRKCGKEIILITYQYGGAHPIRTWELVSDQPSKRGGYWYFFSMCNHEPQIETEVAKEIMVAYGYNEHRKKPLVPQAKNPFLNNPHPWKKR